jgi:hypothetical protein
LFFKGNNKQALFFALFLFKTGHSHAAGWSGEQEKSWFMGRSGSPTFGDLSKVRVK